MQDEIVQYFIVNNDVKMSKGKVSAQVAHAETMFLMRLHDIGHNAWKGQYYDWFRMWYYDGSMTKIVLSASAQEMEQIAAACESFVVVDEGRTEIPSGTMTVVGLIPMPKLLAKPFVGHLKLLN